ncbi:hypothetical protein HORIV_26480 [Vreelandella olivaria]|uniref:rRNA (Cytidine-2'-O-)-methyltransferase n=1 Tax=Vreelandella olivaria TaxID=390919 RepID=A0ABN5WWB8_9GAMM|nr:hypothetical protein HORIV_26480 [Halomonas olivaria]
MHTLEALQEQMAGRDMVLARELTKTFETFLHGTPESLLERLAADPNQARGEFVVIVAGAPPVEQSEHQDISADTLLEALLAEGLV